MWFIALIGPTLATVMLVLVGVILYAFGQARIMPGFDIMLLLSLSTVVAMMLFVKSILFEE